MTTTYSTPMLPGTESVLLAPDAGRTLQFGPGEHIVWKVAGATTGDRFDTIVIVSCALLIIGLTKGRLGYTPRPTVS